MEDFLDSFDSTEVDMEEKVLDEVQLIHDNIFLNAAIPRQQR